MLIIAKLVIVFAFVTFVECFKMCYNIDFAHTVRVAFVCHSQYFHEWLWLFILTTCFSITIFYTTLIMDCSAVAHI